MFFVGLMPDCCWVFYFHSYHELSRGCHGSFFPGGRGSSSKRERERERERVWGLLAVIEKMVSKLTGKSVEKNSGGFLGPKFGPFPPPTKKRRKEKR